jgi:hypothetical protein
MADSDVRSVPFCGSCASRFGWNYCRGIRCLTMSILRLSIPPRFSVACTVCIVKGKIAV